MKVISAPGTKCPKEGNPRQYITDDVAVDVPDKSSYYRRLVKEGSLLIFTPKPPATKKEKGGKE